MSDSDRDIIHNYLKSLKKYLSRLDKAEADEVIKEIESHIYDVLDSQPGQWQAEEILEGFGSPRELASQYVDHMLVGAPPPKGFKAIQTVKKGATKGLYFATTICGYGVSFLLMVVGIYKIVSPEEVGVWGTDAGQSFILGVSSVPPGSTEEILGLWLVPIALGLSFAGAYLTRRILSILKEKI